MVAKLTRLFWDKDGATVMENCLTFALTFALSLTLTAFAISAIVAIQSVGTHLN